jgi:hypothetical protein
LGVSFSRNLKFRGVNLRSPFLEEAAAEKNFSFKKSRELKREAGSEGGGGGFKF